MGNLGRSADSALDVDLDRLIGAHLGIVANAGGGKSGLIRRLLEQTYGKVQHIVLDIEDEFYTLRQRFDYVIAGGQGGDAPATPDNAGALATAALTHGFSLICQLNDLGGDGAREFVDHFLTAMIEAPQELWRPVLVVIDETQRFDATSIRMLTERGRKRGFTAVLASQRLPKIDANVRGDLNNWIMGRVGQSLDRRIMADQLGFSTREANEKLARIEPRHFWAFGPALSRDPMLFEVADVETAMVRPGDAKVPTPPAPEALREIMAGLAAQPLPERADDIEAGASPAEVQEIARLRNELDQLNEQLVRMAELVAKSHAYLVGAGELLVQAIAAGRVAPHVVNPQLTDGAAGTEPERASAPKRTCSPRPAKRPAGTSERAQVQQARTPSREGLNAAANKMLVMLERIAPARVTWGSLATLVGNKARGGNFNAARKGLRESGLIIEEGDVVRAAHTLASGMTRTEAVELWRSVLANPAPRMISALEAGPLSRQDLGAALGIVPRGGNFNNGVAQLVRNGLVIDKGGQLQLASPLPGEIING